MAKKLTKGQKAWATRRANQLKTSREAAIKAGIIKPKNKILAGLEEAVEFARDNQLIVGNKVTVRLPKDYLITNGPAGLPEGLTPYKQLDNAITDLENRILNTVARIKSLGI